MKKSSSTSLRGLRTFCVAARHESFRMAADELFVTASAVSHQIKSLEAELGFPLFERGAKELTLTETGDAMFGELAPLIAAVEQSVAGFRTIGVREAVRISVQPFFASEFFVPRLGEFAARHPEIDIRVGSSDESSDRHPGEADLSIRLFRKPPADLHSDVLFPLRLAPAGSKAFLKHLSLRKGEVQSDFPVIVHESHPNAWRDWSRASGISLPPDLKITRLDSMIAVVRAAEQGIGAALVPVPISNQWFDQGTLVRLFDQELLSDSSYYLVSAASAKPTSAVHDLRAWILEEFASPG